MRMHELAQIGKEAKSSEVIGESGVEVTARMPVDSKVLLTGDWASSLSTSPVSSQRELLVEVPHESEVPSGDQFSTLSIDFKAGFSY
jgi:hypothetical protein